jgi:hypothetical protein
MREVVLRRYRRVLEHGGPFPDLVLIDGGKGQLTAAYDALEQLGLANLVATGLAKKEELLFTRDRPDPIALPDRQPRAAAHPADPRRGAPVRRDVPPAVPDEARPALGTRRDPRDRAAPAKGAADDVRQPGRGAARHARRTGTGRRRKTADLVLAHFAVLP